MTMYSLNTWKRQVPPPQCASISYFSKSPRQILKRYQVLLHFAEAGPGTEGNERQKRMCLTINPRLTSAKSVRTVYDMSVIIYGVVLRIKVAKRIDLRFVHMLLTCGGSDLDLLEVIRSVGVGVWRS